MTVLGISFWTPIFALLLLVVLFVIFLIAAAIESVRYAPPGIADLPTDVSIELLKITELGTRDLIRLAFLEPVGEYIRIKKIPNKPPIALFCYLKDGVVTIASTQLGGIIQNYAPAFENKSPRAFLKPDSPVCDFLVPSHIGAILRYSRQNNPQA